MKKYIYSSILMALFVGMAACGSEESTDQPAQQNEDVRTVEITGTDDMKFVVAEEATGIVTGDASGQNFLLEAIEATPGEEIQLTLNTVSNLPPTAMSHNFALLEMGTDADAFARASITARDNEYIAPDMEGQVIVHTAMLGNGESDTITFTVPEEPGEYVFICTFPGHYAGGMVGTLIVE